jgi:hypothetical protein
LPSALIVGESVVGMSLDTATCRSSSPGVTRKPTLLLTLTSPELVARSSHPVAFH